MKFLSAFLTILAAVIPVTAQIELISDSYFPADLEFEALLHVSSEAEFSDSKQLPSVENGTLFRAVGFDRYARRTYAVENSGSLSIEVVTLIDFRAAYSLLTLLRGSDIHDGPPGDAFVTAPGTVLFCHGRRFVRIRGSHAADALLHRVAASVSNRIGKPERKLPSLISHLPENGLDLSTLKYFPGTEAFETFLPESSLGIIRVLSDMEAARAHYSIENQEGVLSLLKFPTHQLAAEYFSSISTAETSDAVDHRVYLRRIGPLLCILEGSFTSEQADALLSPIQYSYSVQWIYDKKADSSIVWGIPVHILNSTVWSFFLVVMVCIVSILAGIALAGFRLLLRRYFPKNPLDNPKRTEMTRLKLP